LPVPVAALPQPSDSMALARPEGKHGGVIPGARNAEPSSIADAKHRARVAQGSNGDGAPSLLPTVILYDRW